MVYRVARVTQPDILAWPFKLFVTLFPNLVLRLWAGKISQFWRLEGGDTMAMNRSQAKAEHTQKAGHEQFTETVYGVLCAACHNYILIDHTNCPPTCREHETCRQAYSP